MSKPRIRPIALTLTGSALLLVWTAGMGVAVADDRTDPHPVSPEVVAEVSGDNAR